MRIYILYAWEHTLRLDLLQNHARHIERIEVRVESLKITEILVKLRTGQRVCMTKHYDDLYADDSM